MMTHEQEAARIAAAYARRHKSYSYLDPAVYMPAQELERAFVAWLRRVDLGPVDSIRLLEIGCGHGTNLATFLRLGLAPENLRGNELIAERVESARRRLPRQVEIMPGDASLLQIENGTFDVVFQSMVFSSVLMDSMRRALAAKMWSWVRPGGGVLWYDFTFNNPANADVRGIRLGEIARLFPAGRIRTERLTLAPPLARLVTGIHPALYTVFNCAWFLRTHVLCWIRKPATTGR